MTRKERAIKSHCYSSSLTLNNDQYREAVLRLLLGALKDDGADHDLTTMGYFGEKKTINAVVLCREKGVVAGVSELDYFLEKQTGIRTEWLMKDGDITANEDMIARFNGDAREILPFERLILNFLGRMSGVARSACFLVEEAAKFSKSVLITPTRKTLWGLLDKRAAFLGGAGTHRLSLDDAVLIKDTHIAAAQTTPLEYLKKISHHLIGRFAEVEVGTVPDAVSVAKYLMNMRVDDACEKAILLDNMCVEEISAAVCEISSLGDNYPLIEISGGVRADNIRTYAALGADIISVGEMTNSAIILDLSMKVE